MVRFLLSIVTIFIVSDCNELAVLKYDPYPDVTVVLKVNKETYHEYSQDKFTFVHISYSIDIQSDEPLSFEVEKVKATINGVSNSSAYYDTVASVAPFPRRIEKGKSNLDIYVVFPGTIKVTKDNNFKILDFGLSRYVNKKNPHAPIDRTS